MTLVQHELQNAYIGQRVDVTSLTLDKNSITLTTAGDTEQITATVVPSGTPITWTSSDTSVATVSSTGLVTCVTPGTATITAEAFGVTATCDVSEGGWQPGANTLLYLPLVSNAVDQSGNSRATSASGVTYTTVGGVASANFSGGRITVTNNFIDTTIAEKTVSAWVYTNFSSANKSMYIFYSLETNKTFTALTFTSGTSYIDSWTGGPGFNLDTPSSAYTQNQWFHIVNTCKDGTNNNKIYINGQQVAQGTGTSTPRGYSSATFNLGTYVGCSSNNNERFNGNLSQFILEDKAWTAEEVSDYYNKTKTNYGIS